MLILVLNNRKKFNGTLARVSVEELSVLDFSKNTLEERMRYIQNKYQEVSAFYNSYTYCKEENVDGGFTNLCELTQEDMDKYYKYNLNANDYLSDDINVFKLCERDASYLLNSPDIKESAIRCCNRNDNCSLDHIENVEHEVNNDNYRLAPKLDIKAGDYKTKDINKDNLTNEQWERFKKINKSLIMELTQKNEARLNLLDRKIELENMVCENAQDDVKRRSELRITIENIKSIKDDMIRIKKSFTPFVEIKCDKCPTSKTDFCENLDYKNSEHVKVALLLHNNDSVKQDLNIIAYDINVAIKRLIKMDMLSSYDLDLIDSYRFFKGNIKRVAEDLEKHRQQIYRDLDKIVYKIMLTLNKKI